MAFAFVVYKITFPNGKIYIGKDEGAGGHSINYFGSWSNELVERDFRKDELMSFTLTKEILFESTDRREVRRMESELIHQHRSNHPDIGYNQTHRKRSV